MRRSEPFPPVPIHRSWSTVLFDLDGTLVHSAPVILDGLGHMFRELGREVPAESELMEWIGPPLLESLANRADIHGDEALRARDLYRGYTADREHRVALFPGIAGLLSQLNALGIPLAVATSKPEERAALILKRLGIDDLFTACIGSDDARGRQSKSDVVGEALLRLAAAGTDIESPVLVGDRCYDVEGGAAHGVPTILVEWGYGTPEDAPGALAIVASTDQLRTLLVGG